MDIGTSADVRSTVRRLREAKVQYCAFLDSMMLRFSMNPFVSRGMGPMSTCSFVPLVKSPLRGVLFLFAVLVVFASLPVGAAHAENWFGDPVVTSTSQSIRVVKIHDMNNDGVADLVGCSISPSATVVWLGDPSGMMTFVQGIPGPMYGSFIVVDENADGFPDLIAGDPFEIWDNDGAGHFVDTGRAIDGSMGDTADLNNDDLPEVVTKTGTDSVTIYLGTLGGLSTSGQGISMRVDGEPAGSFRIRDLAVGDIDGDQNADILLAGANYGGTSYRAQFRLRLGVGGGAFDSIQVCGGSEYHEFDGMEMTDLDLDGDMDIAVMIVGLEGGLTAFYRYDRASATMRLLGGAPTTGLPHMARMGADLLPDLILCDYPNIVRICRGTGPGSYQVVQTLAGVDAGIGRMTGGYGPDLIAATRTNPSEIRVHPGIVITTDIEETIDNTAGMRVWPSIGALPVRVRWDRSVADPNAWIEVIAVDGRRVRRLQGCGGETRWDLDSEDGSRVGSGVYWIRLVTGGGAAVVSRRVIVLR
jgi:hypothetical protein